LILIRHGKSEPWDSCPDDAQRKLTRGGIKDLEKILPALKSHVSGLKLRLVSSPLLRAVQTAQIIAKYLEIEEIEQLDWIGNGDDEGLRDAYQCPGPAAVLTLVGHEPHLSAWSRQLCGFTIPFGKGSAVGFCVTSREPLRARPEWMLLPEIIQPQRLSVKCGAAALPQFQKILRFQLCEVFQTLQKFLNAPDDPETAHQFRIKIRAFRSVLFFVKPLLDPEQYKTAQDRMRQLMQKTGRLREIDILKSEWMKLLAVYPPLEKRQSVLTAALTSERQQEQAIICGDTSEMTLAIFEIWEWAENALAPEAADAGQAESDIKTQSFACFTKKRIRNHLKKVVTGLETIDDKDFGAIHALRIQCKRLRYALGILDPLLDLKRTDTAASLRALQDILGGYCDTRRNLSILKELCAQYDSPEMHCESAVLSGYQIRMMEENLSKIKAIEVIRLR